MLRSASQSSKRQRLIERIDYDGREGKLGITFRDAGIKTLVKELGEVNEAAGAGT